MTLAEDLAAAGSTSFSQFSTSSFALFDLKVAIRRNLSLADFLIMEIVYRIREYWGIIDPYDELPR